MAGRDRRAGGRASAIGRGRGAGRARPGRWVPDLCAQAGPVGCSCTQLGFQPVFFRLGIFPESPNEHCSL